MLNTLHSVIVSINLWLYCLLSGHVQYHSVMICRMKYNTIQYKCWGPWILASYWEMILNSRFGVWQKRISIIVLGDWKVFSEKYSFWPVVRCILFTSIFVWYMCIVLSGSLSQQMGKIQDNGTWEIFYSFVMCVFPFSAKGCATDFLMLLL